MARRMTGTKAATPAVETPPETPEEIVPESLPDPAPEPEAAPEAPAAGDPVLASADNLRAVTSFWATDSEGVDLLTPIGKVYPAEHWAIAGRESLFEPVV